MVRLGQKTRGDPAHSPRPLVAAAKRCSELAQIRAIVIVRFQVAMSIVVQKYGGSSVADIEKLRKVAEQVVATQRAGHQVVVVVSAMGKSTENLLALARAAAQPPDSVVGEGSPPRRELDMLVSTGERTSMALLSIAIQARGSKAISFTGSQSGIMTNDRHFDARIIEVRPHRIEDELHRGRVVIVAGYQGMSYKREITTLGRGGSDTTAVALAAALEAERCEIYSDVDGVYSADPRSVEGARHLPQLDYEVMQQMAETGAKVLNAQAVEWARKNKIAIHARRMGEWSGEAEPRETVVHQQGAASRAIVRQSEVAYISAPPQVTDELLAGLRTEELPIRDLSLGAHGLTATLPLLNVPDIGRVRAKLFSGSIPNARLEEGWGSVSLVGVEVGSPVVASEALSLLPTRPLWTLVSPLRITCLLPPSALDEVERAWHDRFVAS